MLFLLITVGTVARLVPTLVTGEPFSTDAWPVINLADRINEGLAPPLPQATHANTAHVWPGLPLAMAMYDSLVGCVDQRVVAYALTSLLAISLMLVLLSWIRRAYPAGASYAVAYAIFFPSFVLMTSAPLKEFLGLALVMGSLHVMSAAGGHGSPLLAVLLAAAVLTHPIPTAVLLASVVLSSVLARFLGLGEASGRVAVFSAVALLALAAYNLVMFRKIVMVFRPIDLAVYGATVAAVVTLYLKAPRRSGAYSKIVLGTLIAAAVAVFASVFSRVPWVMSTWWAPLTLFLVPALIGVATLFAVKNGEYMILAKSMLLVIGASAIYLTLWKAEYLMIVHRVLNYLFLVGAIPLASLAERRRGTALAIVAVVLAASSAALLSTVSGRDPMTSYWLYRPSEVALYSSLDSVAPGRAFLGDERLMYFFLDSAENVSVSVQELFRVLRAGCSTQPREAIISWFNKEVGFVGIVDVVEAGLREDSRLVSYGENAVVVVGECVSG